MDVLSLVVGACNRERNRSAFDLVHSKKRNNLNAKKSAELVYIFSNLRLLRKITAGDKAEIFHAWRTDGEKGVASINPHPHFDIGVILQYRHTPESYCSVWLLHKMLVSEFNIHFLEILTLVT